MTDEQVARELVAAAKLLLVKKLTARQINWDLRKLKRAIHEVLVDLVVGGGNFEVDVDTNETYSGTGDTWNAPGEPAEWEVVGIEGDLDLDEIKIPIDKFIKKIGSHFRFPKGVGSEEINEVLEEAFDETFKYDGFDVYWSTSRVNGSITTDIEIEASIEGRNVSIYPFFKNISELARDIKQDAGTG